LTINLVHHNQVHNGTQTSVNLTRPAVNVHAFVNSSAPEQVPILLDAGSEACYSERFGAKNVRDIFAFTNVSKPPFPVAPDHPITPVGTARGGGNNALHTNKFYANWMLGDQKRPIYTFPYALAWTGHDSSSGTSRMHHGIGVWHTDESGVKYGPGEPAKYFFNPLIHQMILSALELSAASTPQLLLRSPNSMSATGLITIPGSGSGGGRTVMEIPLVQGMGFLTAVYRNATLSLGTYIGFQSFLNVTSNRSSSNLIEGSSKFLAKLKDGSSWVVYILPTGSSNKFELKRDGDIYIGSRPFSGTVQMARLSGSADAYDKTYGVYAINAKLSGSVINNQGQYTISWTKLGARNRELLMFALPHQVESMTEDSSDRLIDLVMRTTTKGNANGILGNSITMLEAELPSTVGFLPWSPDLAHQKKTGVLCQPKQSLPFDRLARKEIEEDIVHRISTQDSVYWSGKIIASYARLAHAAFAAQNHELSGQALQKLKSILVRWAGNSQRHRLLYDPTWGGVVTSWAYDQRNVDLDYGNAKYSDHHFHYGYWVYAAAVAAEMDRNWLSADEGQKVKVWVNSLVRDYAASNQNDQYFPFSRSFDWYHGHSW
jgi:endo-1,3(4)-beta-glucanase